MGHEDPYEALLFAFHTVHGARASDRHQCEHIKLILSVPEQKSGHPALTRALPQRVV